MSYNFHDRAASKSDEELYYCIDNREKYLPETVEAAVSELQKRGAEFSEEELRVISEDMQARREMAEHGTGIFGIFNTNWDNNQVYDPDAPAMFSKRAIFAFSVLCSVLFGAILLAINVNKTQNRDKALWVVIYGVGFIFLQAIIAGGYNPIATILTSIAGAYIMDNFFWNRYIGKPTLYRARAIWIPLLIGLALAAAGTILVSKGILPVIPPK